MLQPNIRKDFALLHPSYNRSGLPTYSECIPTLQIACHPSLPDVSFKVTQSFTNRLLDPIKVSRESVVGYVRARKIRLRGSFLCIESAAAGIKANPEWNVESLHLVSQPLV